MKSLVIAMILSAGVFAQAECVVQSKRYPELQTEKMNADAICEATLVAILDTYDILPYEYDVVVKADGGRTTFTVDLEIFLNKDGKSKYRTEGLLNWSPDGTYVQIIK